MSNPLATSLKALQQAVTELQAAGYTKSEAELAMYVLWGQPDISIIDLQTKVKDLQHRIDVARTRVDVARLRRR